jgi:hypothetical protein
MPPVSASAADETTFFNCLAEDVKGAVDTVVVVPAKVIVDGSSTAGLGLDEIGGVGSDF